ncbi:MAG: thioredoxin domain-containing protein [Methanomassiliicoccales archaeon]|nr:MAG: thioredoxin domain-containing protein [Methanomassiliicoccales archaeon]
MNYSRRPNSLINEKSPYLLQHAHNPVNWYPWSEKAFEKAKKEDKPIFLSIGYSTCHWCHVMEKESFEDPEVADLLNKNFICIKVDREERPDIDSIYMTACQMITGRGGWPLTIIMTPDKKPFFAATYIPKESRLRLTGLLDLIPRIAEMWTNRKGEIHNSAEQVTTTIQKYSESSKGEELKASTLDSAFGVLQNIFDENYGGFGNAPKFPTPHNLLFLLRYWKRTGYEKALHMVEETLMAMRIGGIWDHVGFGFHRYSTDRYWLVPHFEKMLYDQALLAIAYTEAFSATGKLEYRETAEKILYYVTRDMTSADGGFYSAEDADSEGQEGKFYLWTEEEIREALGEEAKLIKKVFNISDEGNYVDEIIGKKTKKNIPYLKKPLSELARDLNIPSKDLIARLDRAKGKLYKIRRKRIPPMKDDKILTDWNGLMIAAFAKAGSVFYNSDFIETAKKSADFILTNMVEDNKALYHRFRDKEAAIDGFLDDYAFLVWGLSQLYESTFDVKYLSYAIEFTKYMIKHFWDEIHGGFYSTSVESEKLLVRQKKSYDGAIPSGNSVALLNLIQLARITADSDLEDKAHKNLIAFSNDIKNYPSSQTMFLMALDFLIGPSFEVVIVGDLESADTNHMLSAIRDNYVPNKVLIQKPIAESPEIVSIAPYTKNMTHINGKTTAYVCHNFSCELPTNEVDKMLNLLETKKNPQGRENG